MKEGLVARLTGVVEKLNEIQKREYLKSGFTFIPDLIEFKDKGKKFVYIDIGTSGAWMVEKETGEIYNIRAYGQIDRNKKIKADIGNIFTVDPEVLYAKRYNYLR